jgi:hypothetical protein
MQTIQVGKFKARFSEMIDSVRAGKAIGVAYDIIFNNGALIQGKSCGSASREFPGAASFKLTVDRPACDLRLLDPSALRVPVAFYPKRSRGADSAISGTSAICTSK